MPARFAREADFDCFLLAGRYTLLDQRGLAELLPLCVEKRIGIIIGGVYNSGILVNPVPGATFNYRPAETAWLERAQRLQAVCDRHQTPLTAAAIQFPLAHPAVATVLTGVRSVAELEENERMMRFPVPPALWQELKDEGLLPPDAPVPET
jgi:D-threo-aldose 1-dehydrogenase